MMYRNKERKAQTSAGTEVAMTAMSTDNYNNNNNNTVEGVSGKTYPDINTQTNNNENDYVFSKFDPPSPAAAAAGNIDYESSPMYESLDNNGSDSYSKL